ncbi:MAG: tRNA (adenosine(37)-N6)-dimethylallyltransferase MiaA [Planctomycetes bacterium]|nr:tRNA (adenosine(37)-N6)-dimethylallyltransferase MiaA [Planctomycetota bacterium]
MILILGTTGSGKGQLAFNLAKTINAEIISVDSMKVYRRMDIGTAKPSIERQNQIKHHLIDVVEPSDSFSVAAFLEMASQKTNQLNKDNKSIIAVGGTALYIKAMLYGLFEGPGTNEQIRKKLQTKAKNEGVENLYLQLEAIDPETAEKIHQNDTKRVIRALEVYELTGKPISTFQKQWEKPAHNWTIVGLRREKLDASSRINKRVKRMFDEGLVDEVKSLLNEDKPLSQQAGCAIGYAEIINYLQDKTNLEETTELIKKNTRKLAKGQRTWFKTFENVNWLDVKSEDTAEDIFENAKKLLSSLGKI